MKRATFASIAIVILVLAAIWFAAWQRVRTEAEQAIGAASVAQSNLAIAFDENADNAIGDVDQTLAVLAIEFQTKGHQGGGVAAQWPVNPALIRGLGVIRADGAKMVALGEISILDPVPGHDISHHRAIRSRALHISPPEKLAYAGGWRVAMSRRIDNPDGSFYGVAIAIVDPAFFTQFYGRADLGARGVVSLLGTDGIEIARRAGALSTFGADMRESNLFREATRRSSGTFLSSGRSDGLVRVLSFRRMQRYPLAVMLGVPRDEILATARERERLYYLLAALASNVAVLVALGFNHALARERRHFDAITRAQARLRESDARSKAITESMAGGVVTTDFDGRVLTVNAAASRMFGYEAREMIGMHVLRLAGETSHRDLLAAIEGAHAKGTAFRTHEREYLAVRKDGTCFEVEVLVSALSMEGVITYIAIMHDISERKSMESVMRSREARYRATFDQALVGVVYADLGSRITQANQTFCDMLGYSEQEVLGRTFADLSHPEDRPASLARIERLLADPTSAVVRHTTKRYLRKDGSTVWVIISVSLIARDDGTPDYFLTMVQDISEIKRAEQMKSEFVSTVSHELRTPLTSIRGSLGLLAGGVAGALPQPARELVTIADNNCGRLIRLVNDILDTEKIASGKMRFDLRVTELAPLVARAVEAVSGFAQQSGVVLRTNVPREPIACEVDGDRLIQVLTNFISNAVKFSPTTIPVEITLSREGAGAARIEVRDHGSGIPSEFRSRIFQRFSQADASDARQKAGTGLGLSIAKGIVDKLGGEIGFRTAEGEGTTFFVILPAAVKARAQPDRQLEKET